MRIGGDAQPYKWPLLPHDRASNTKYLLQITFRPQRVYHIVALSHITPTAHLTLSNAFITSSRINCLTTATKNYTISKWFVTENVWVQTCS